MQARNTATLDEVIGPNPGAPAQKLPSPAQIVARQRQGKLFKLKRLWSVRHAASPTPCMGPESGLDFTTQRRS